VSCRLRSWRASLYCTTTPPVITTAFCPPIARAASPVKIVGSPADTDSVPRPAKIGAPLSPLAPPSTVPRDRGRFGSP